MGIGNIAACVTLAYLGLLCQGPSGTEISLWCQVLAPLKPKDYSQTELLKFPKCTGQNLSQYVVKFNKHFYITIVDLILLTLKMKFKVPVFIKILSPPNK